MRVVTMYTQELNRRKCFVFAHKFVTHNVCIVKDYADSLIIKYYNVLVTFGYVAIVLYA